MKFLFDLAERYNKPRLELKPPNHMVPEFVTVIWSFIKWFFKVSFYWLFIFHPFFFAITGIYSGSMTPTCQTNEFVLSSRLGYGLKLSKIFQIQTKNTTFLDKSLWQYDSPKLGDVISFQVPNMDKESTYIKRVVGNEGDRVQFKNGILFINGNPVKLEFKKQYKYIENQQTTSGFLYEETLPNGVKHDVFYQYQPGYGSSDNTGEFLVPPGHVFGVGDHRHNSDDSRSFLGFIDKRYILGKVTMVLFSNGNIRTLNLNQMIQGMRWDRCLKWMI